jgi:hypothetical protein
MRSSEHVSTKISLSLTHNLFKSRPRGVAVFHCESEKEVTESGLGLGLCPGASDLDIKREPAPSSKLVKFRASPHALFVVVKYAAWVPQHCRSNSPQTGLEIVIGSMVKFSSPSALSKILLFPQAGDINSEPLMSLGLAVSADNSGKGLPGTLFATPPL